MTFMSISAAKGIENCKLCVVFIFIDTKKMFDTEMVFWQFPGIRHHLLSINRIHFAVLKGGLFKTQHATTPAKSLETVAMIYAIGEQQNPLPCKTML